MWKVPWGVLCLYCLIQTCHSQFQRKTTREIKYQIAGIFGMQDSTQKFAFNESLNRVHRDSYRIEPIIIETPRNDSYSIWRALCSASDLKPIAIFGPQNPIADGAVLDQCAKANIPHIQATWQPLNPDLELNTSVESEINADDIDTDEQTEETSIDTAFKKISINFYPDSDEISYAYSKLLEYYKWENFAVLYEDTFGLLRVQKILAEKTDKYPVRMYKLDPNGDNRMVFKELQSIPESRIILDCHVDRILKYMDDAAALKMINLYQHYILVTIDASMVAESLVKLPSNITWLSLTEYDRINSSQHNLNQRVGKWAGRTPDHSTSVTQFQTEALVMDDIANHIVKALDEMESPDSVCGDEEEPWPYGAKLQQQILQTKTVGVTGNIEFDERGRRINYNLYVNEIHVTKRNTLGRWESANGTSIIETRSKNDTNGNQLASKHFIVIAREAKPYFSKRQFCDNEIEDCENNKYEGFSVDLVKEIFRILKEEKYNYTYSFVHEKDKSYGHFDPNTKKWDGLIGDLLDKKADLAVCDLTITEERKKVVDFSVPFMSLGISILFTQEHEVEPGMFSFLYPYTFDVWIYTATAYCLVSLCLFVCARISPADWENPEPCEKDPEELENIWTFKNCTWLTMGSIMTQGCDILPKAIGTRWVCAMWWFFGVIVCQTYIAQLSASMTSALEMEPINNVEDLYKQTKILYGALDGGSTLEFFRLSKDKMYRRMYENMKANPVVLVKSNDEGEKMVLNRKNKYAFFMESCTIEYKLKRNCELKKVGSELDSKDYGIAMPANSPFRSQINRAILKLTEMTLLKNIKNKWWNEEYEAKDCEEKVDDNDIEGDLEMKNLMGAFVVLVVGLVFCLFMAAAEFMNAVRSIVVKEQVPHKEVLIQELKTSLNFFQLQKPVLRNPSRAPSIAGSSDSSEKREMLEKHSTAIENFLEMEKEVQ